MGSGQPLVVRLLCFWMGLMLHIQLLTSDLRLIKY